MIQSLKRAIARELHASRFCGRGVAMKKLRISLIFAGCIGVLTLLSSGLVQAADIALKGYDPVAYFTDQRATVGNEQYQYEWDGALYQFASAKHLEMFKADPDHYLPQYNTLCAASVAKGVKVYGNPEHWLVVGDRLYLFGGPVGPDLMRADPSAMKSKADANWPTVVQLPDPSRK
jgi:YHS domain-containing protein